MFGIGPLEMIVILGLALIILGPEKFPEAGKMVGKAVREFRSLTTDLARDMNLDDDRPPKRHLPENVVEHDAPAEEQEPATAFEEPTTPSYVDDEGTEHTVSVDDGEHVKPEEREPGPV